MDKSEHEKVLALLKNIEGKHKRRIEIACQYANSYLGIIDRWLEESLEITKFTYVLTQINIGHMAAAISVVPGADRDSVDGYLREINEDEALKIHHRKNSKGFADPECRFGRRMAWYAIVRHKKPKVVLETGVDKGLGSHAITAALMKNQLEGHHGKYFGIDLSPAAGYLLTEPYSKFGKLIVGDSIENIKSFNEYVDVFISDSDHTAGYERAEYEAITPKLAKASIIISDNSHVTDELDRYSRSKNRKFLSFSEKPKNHFYPGAVAVARHTIDPIN